jgi:hypothetical protein
MNEKPILFSAPMVRAILAGDKTQTRRLVKPQPLDDFPHQGSIDFDGFLPFEDLAQWSAEAVGGGAFKTETQECPYGTVGDHLYVRETFYAYGRWETRYSAKKKRDEWHFIDMTAECDRLYQYDTEHITPAVGRGGVTPAWHKRPSLFMPRAASRILLEIAGVRVERLQDISQADAFAEGAMSWAQEQDTPIKDLNGGDDRLAFMALWESINGADSWAANPWVWVVEFRRI